MAATGGTITFNLSRELEPGEAARLRWPGIRPVPAATSGMTAQLALGPDAPGATWRFGWLELPDGSGGFGEPIPLAVAFSDADTVAFEDGLSLDPARGAFLCGEQPSLRAWTSAGRDLGLAVLEEDEPEDPDEIQYVRGTAPNGVRVGPVPVLAQGEVGEGTDPDEPHEPPEEPGDEGPGDPGEGPGTGPDPEQPPGDPLLDPTLAAPEPVVDPTEYLTFPHALLAKGAIGWPEQAGVNAQGELSAHIAAVRTRIRPRLGRSQLLLPAERATHLEPGWAQYRIDSSGVASCIAELPSPEPAWAAEMATFRSSRELYFAAAAAEGSAYSVNPLGDVAREYVDSYRRLIWALPREGMHRSEYDLIVAMDAVELNGVRDLLISPMSPLSVAYHAGLALRLGLAADGTNPLGLGDLGALSLQWVVPLLNHRGSWFESIPMEEAGFGGATSSSMTPLRGRTESQRPVHREPHCLLPKRASQPCNPRKPHLGRLCLAGRRKARRRCTPEADGYRTAGGRRCRSRQLPAPPDGCRDGGCRPRGPRNPGGSRSRRGRSGGGPRCSHPVQHPPEERRRTRQVRAHDLPVQDPRRPGDRAGRAGHARTHQLCGDGRQNPAGSRSPRPIPSSRAGVFAAFPVEGASELERIQYRTLELVGGQGGERLVPGGTRMVRARASGKDLDGWYEFIGVVGTSTA